MHAAAETAGVVSAKAPNPEYVVDLSIEERDISPSFYIVFCRIVSNAHSGGHVPVAKKYKPDTVRAAFQRFFVGEENADGEQRAFCPVCENPETSSSPSAMFNPNQGIWNCLKSNHGGRIYTLVQDLKQNQGFDIRAEAMKHRNNDPTFAAAREEGVQRRTAERKGGVPLPTPEQIQAWTDRLIADKHALNTFVSERGISQATILHFNIGWDGSRYTIPIYDEVGELVNVRRYKLNASAHSDKMLNLPGHGEARLYGLDTLMDETATELILTEGETDRILGWQEGLPTVTHTSGAGTFRATWGPLFTGKIVYICYDNDDTGKKGAARAAAMLAPYAEAVYTITIPIANKGADLTDYLHKEGHSASDFRLLMKEAEENGAVASTAARNAPVAEDGIPVSLMESMSPDIQHETMKLVVSVAGKQAEPFTSPKTIEVTCDMSKGTPCNTCPIAFANGAASIEIRADDPNIARFVDVPETRRKTLLKEVTGARCTDRSEFDVVDSFHIEELLVQPSVDDRRDDETQTPLKRAVLSVGTYRSGVNQKASLVGRNVPDPKSGRLRFVAWKNERVDMDIDRFELSASLRKRLQRFQPVEGQSPLQKCFEIADDMSRNITHIYGRDLLHVAYDLVWHSVQTFRVFDFTVEKGWLEAAVVGDTRTGKSEIANRLIGHYRAGTLLSCEGMSFAGIVGGVQQIDGRWHLTWGAVPMNDRRLVVLDEMSGLAEKNVVEQMSSIRSSGIAQITKIQSEQTSARTRLIWISNPADGSDLSAHSDGGLWALRSVVPNNEDIARFDFVTAAAKGDVPDDVINAGFAEAHNPQYSAEDCEALVKWAWSLRRDQVRFSSRATTAAIEAARDIGGRYIQDPPLIQSENVRFKILRIAAAIAARTFSADKNGGLLVKAEHVKDAVTFLDMTYSQESLGYQRRSRRAFASHALAERQKSLCKDFLRKHEDVLLVLRMVGGNVFKAGDFRAFANIDEDVAKDIQKRFLEWRMITIRTRGEMSMNPILLSVIRELEDEIEDAIS
jgi:hypothetical protein